LVDVVVGASATLDVAVVASIFVATLAVRKVNVELAPTVCAIAAVGYVVHVDAAMLSEAVKDGDEHEAEYIVHALVHEHVVPPKLVATEVFATHAAVVCSEHDAWPEPVVVVPTAHARQLADDVYVAPPSE